MAMRGDLPFRAILAAQFQGTWNRMAKEMGRSGRWGLVLLLGILVLLGGLPTLGVAGAAGYALGIHFDSGYSPLIAGSGLAFCALLVGGISGILGGTKVLRWESYRAYPVPLRQIFAAELVAGVGDPLTALAASGALAFCLGIAAAHPSLLPISLLLWIQMVLWMLLAEHLVGSLAAALMKRMKVALVLFGVGVWGLSVLSSMLPGMLGNRFGQPVRGLVSPGAVEWIRGIVRAVMAFLHLLPSTHAAQALADALGGAWIPALLRQVAPVALLLGALALMARRMEREAEPEALNPPPPKGKEKLWTFKRPAEGLAKLHWKTILGSHLGRFGLLMPVMTVVLLKGPFARVAGHGAWALPGAFAYVALAGSQMQFNQFGLDGHGVKSLLLLPIRPRDILLGKMQGLAMYQGLQAAFLLLLLAVLLSPALGEMLAALCLAACFFFVQLSLGQWTSCWMPRAMPRDSLKSGSLPMPVVLLSMGAAVANTLFFGGTFAIFSWKAPSLLLPVMAALAGLCALLYRRLLPFFERHLDESRERLMEALG